MTAKDHELHAAASRLGLTARAMQHRVRTWGRDRAFTAPRGQGHRGPVDGVARRTATLSALTDFALTATLDALPLSGWCTRTTIERRSGLTRKRLRRTLRLLEASGVIERRPAPDHADDPRHHRWLYARTARARGQG